jgi:DMSO reductase family type II enzyme molybdopterin subunit
MTNELSLAASGKAIAGYRGWEDIYRQQWRWDKVTWASHCIDCYPGNCPFRAYVRNGIVWHEEAAAVFTTVEEGVPDMNPMGCQKGAAWSRTLYGPERVLYPLKRVGERGEGKWKRISWDEALTEVADALLDAIQEQGPESIVALSGCNTGGTIGGGRGRIINMLGGLTTDLNAEMNDFAVGHYLTFGKFDPVSSIDDWFHSELIFIAFMNPAYTRIPHAHYIWEARYKGAEVAILAPDFSPSAMHADYHLPVKPGSDAAFFLGMAQVVMSEGIYDKRFVITQTDLPFLVRLDNERFLRESDMVAGGRDDRFYVHDMKENAPSPATRGTLDPGAADPALEGEWEVKLADGKSVRVTTVFARTKQRLDHAYTPEQAQALCGIHAGTIRSLARKAATRRTNILCGLNNASKYYHGDLMERAQLLLLGLTGNWGRKGTGVRTWGLVGWSGMLGDAARGGPEATREMMAMRERVYASLLEQDPELTPEILSIEIGRGNMPGAAATQAGRRRGMTGREGGGPPVFFWYYHCGYDELWARDGWSDPSMPRPLDQYVTEAVEEGWWDGHVWPKDVEPRVFIESGGNALRRTRGGQTTLLKHLWPKLKMVVVSDYRLSITACYADIFLPMSTQYEKLAFGIPSTHTMNLTFGDKVVESPGEALPEFETFYRLAVKVEERAKVRGLTEFTDLSGRTRPLTNLGEAYSGGEKFLSEETRVDQALKSGAIMGTLPEDASLATVRERGYFRFQNLGVSPRSIGQSTDPRNDETFVPYRNHVEKLEPYPTLTRRAQFYIDHPWLIEAGEHMPCHKEPPKMGGDHPFMLLSGHNRWSIHSLNTANALMLETHRGRPHAVLSTEDAARLGIADNEEVRIFNDMNAFIVPAKTSPSVRPGTVIVYNGWEPYQFSGWNGPNDVEPGMVKWLHFAGGYGHLKYSFTQWQPVPADRGARVGIEKVKPEEL